MSGVTMKIGKSKKGAKPKALGFRASAFQEDEGGDDTDDGLRTEIVTFGGDHGHGDGGGNASYTIEKDLIIPVPAPRYAKMEGRSGEAMPLLMANLPPELLGDMAEDEKFKVDMSLRAGDIGASSQAYSSVPIAQFGAAMLRGMGWNGPSPEDLAAQEKLSRGGQGVSVLGMGGSGGPPPNLTRDARLGLGAVAKPPAKYAKGAKAERGNELWRKRAQEKVNAQVLQVGVVVRLCSGEHGGRRATVVATAGVPGLEKIRVSMETDGGLEEIGRKEVIAVSLEELGEKPFLAAEVAAREPVPATKKRPRPENEQKQEGNGGEPASASTKKPRSTAETAWLVRGIRVRVVSKTAAGDSAYLKKGDVLDLHEKGVAAVRLDDGAVLERVQQRHLETVLPSSGGECLVLYGVHKGQRARLLEKNKQNETVVVELQEELAVVAMGMDAVAATAP